MPSAAITALQGLRDQAQIQPGQKHGFRGKASLSFRNAAIAKFFQENL